MTDTDADGPGSLRPGATRGKTPAARRITAAPTQRARLAPDDEALAAIIAALEQSFARPPAEHGPSRPGWRTSPSAWRFSGRWWSGPAAQRRERPGR